MAGSVDLGELGPAGGERGEPGTPEKLRGLPSWMSLSRQAIVSCVLLQASQCRKSSLSLTFDVAKRSRSTCQATTTCWPAGAVRANKRTVFDAG